MSAPLSSLVDLDEAEAQAWEAWEEGESLLPPLMD